MFKRTILSSLILANLPVYSATSIEKNAITPTIQQIKQSTNNQLLLAVGLFDPLTEQLNFSKSKVPSIGSDKYSIVQFHDGKADSEWLRKKGIKVVSYLPNNAFIVVTNHTTKKILKNNSDIRWTGQYLSSYKISPELLNNNLKSRVDKELMVALFNDFPRKNIRKLFRKYLPKIEIKEILLGKGNKIILSLNNSDINTIINTLSVIDAVQFVEPVKPMTYLNTEAVSAVQGNIEPDGAGTNDIYIPSNTPIFDKGLTGSGQIIGVADSGLDSNEDWFVHYDNGSTVTHIVTEAEDTVVIPSNDPNVSDTFAVGTTYPDRKVFGYFVMPRAEAYDEAGASFHGTHVSGSAVGDRLASIDGGPSGTTSSPTSSGYDNDDGMAPNAQILFQDIGAVVEIDGVDEAVLPGRASSPMWQQAYDAGVRIHSNSYGELDGAGTYSFSDLRVDETLHELEDMLIVFAAGNDGSNENTIGSPGNAKNVLTVGMLFHGNSEFVQRDSSRGPTDDGRLKPDIMATGNQIESAAGNLENSTTISPPARATLTGTSMATPITAGSAALMRQYYTDGFYPTGVANADDAHIPTGPLMKATLINGAGLDGGHFNNNIGWGRVNLSGSLLFNDSEKKLRAWEITNPNGLKTGESIDFKLEVKSGQDLAVTLAWYDLPGPFGSSKTLINDLDLTVKFNNEIYKGNIFGGEGESATGGSKDSLNTVEQVRISTPVEGTYTITVKAENIPGNGSLNAIRQGFGLIASGDFDDIGATPDAMSPVSNLSAAMQNDDGIALSWNGGDNADFYEVYRAEGSCATADFKLARFVGNSENNSYTDFRTLGGNQYAYKIRAGQYGELGDLSSTCADVASLQACDFLPSFAESSINVSNNVGDLCHNKLEWSMGTSNCSATPNIKYNIYRSTDSDFTPNSSNLLTTITGTSFDDVRAPDTPAYYIIRAEDDGGTETTGTSRVRSQAIGTGSTSSPVFEDVDNIAIMNLVFPWQVVSDKAADGILSYKTGQANGSYPPDQCSSIVTNTISLTNGDSNPSIDYKALFDLEENWDGVVVEISTDNGANWTDLPPNGGYPGDFSETTNTPVNACGYASTHGAFSGSNNDTFESFSHDLTAFVGQDVKIRWRLSTDPASEFNGFYIDSIQYPNVESPTACTVNTAADKPQAGLYFDKGRNGHGFVVEPIANSDLYFTVFYTYKDDGTPEWYTSLSTLENNVLNMNLDDDTLLRFTHDFSVDATGAGNPNTIDTSIGTNVLKIDFNSTNIADSDACTDGVNRNQDSIALASWQLGAQQGDWCIEPLIAEASYPSPDFGGTWWTGIDDDGWGLSLSFSGDLIVVTIYYFDANGQPRWAQGLESGFQIGEQISVDMLQFAGYGRDATPIELTNSAAGSIVLTLDSNIGGNNVDGTLSVNVIYQGSEGGTWTRTNAPLTIFTEPHN